MTSFRGFPWRVVILSKLMAPHTNNALVSCWKLELSFPILPTTYFKVTRSFFLSMCAYENNDDCRGGWADDSMVKQMASGTSTMMLCYYEHVECKLCELTWILVQMWNHCFQIRYSCGVILEAGYELYIWKSHIYLDGHVFFCILEVMLVIFVS